MSGYRYYLFDLGLLIKERAKDALKQRNKTQTNSKEWEFESGRILAFNEVISIMQQQAEGMGIPLADIQLDDIVPDRDLI